MSWSWLAVALVAIYLIQTAVLGPLGLGAIDLFLVLALLCGLVAPVHDARLAAWAVGLAQDAGGGGVLGLHAFAWGLVGLLLTRMRPVINLRLWWARLLVTLAAALPGELLVLLHARYIEGALALAPGRLVGHCLSTSFLAATLAALITVLPRLHRAARRQGHLAHR